MRSVRVVRLRAAVALTATVVAALVSPLAAGSASAATPLNHTGTDKELKIIIESSGGKGPHITVWKGSSIVSLHRTTDVTVFFMQYNESPNDGNVKLVKVWPRDLGNRRSFSNVSAPAQALNRNYPVGDYLCVESDAFSGRPCARVG